MLIGFRKKRNNTGQFPNRQNYENLRMLTYVMIIYIHTYPKRYYHDIIIIIILKYILESFSGKSIFLLGFHGCVFHLCF